MGKQALGWEVLIKKFEINKITENILIKSCIFDIDNRTVYFSDMMAAHMFSPLQAIHSSMKYADFFTFLSPESAEELEKNLILLMEKREFSLQTPIFLSTDGINPGALIHLLGSSGQPYILGVVHEICTTIFEANLKMENAIEKLNQMIYHDRLTGLKNRYCFERDMAQRFLDPHAEGDVIYIAIKKFKMYNDVYGHQFGNLVLKEIAGILRLFLSGCLGIYRLEGDEFLIHMKETNRAQILEVLTPLLMQLRHPRVISGHRVYISTNIGIAIYPEDGQTSEQILKNADIAMYTASKHNKDSVTFFLDSTSEALKRRYILETELRSSIYNNFDGFRMVYQPIVDGRTGAWMGGEALLRYTSKTYGDTAVEEVIEILEYTSLILEVGKWAAKNAIRECGRWHRQGCRDSMVHVNCSALQVGDEEFIRCLEHELKTQKLEPGYLICELTETALINDMEIGIDFCNKLNALGVQVALDDFGTGYSSLSYLRMFPIYQIKVDKSFAMQYTIDDYSQIIISTISGLATRLGIGICVEGVENRKTYEELQKLQVKQIQGFFFGKPLESEDFLKRFLNVS